MDAGDQTPGVGKSFANQTLAHMAQTDSAGREIANRLEVKNPGPSTDIHSSPNRARRVESEIQELCDEDYSSKSEAPV
jgi:hypothetical protein